MSRRSAGVRAPALPTALLRRACQRAVWLDRLVRTTYLGLTTMHVLLGAGAARGDVGGATAAGLVLVALAFHVHIFLMNDVIDLEVDATQPRRADHPLVRGLRGDGVSRRCALVVAWLGAAIALALTLALGAGRNAWLALAAAFALIGVYNVWGKRCPVPPLTDAVQALGWWGLILYGYWLVDPHAGLAEIRDRALPLLAFSMGFTLLITGIHGGLRDLVNDLAHGRTNTSIYLGARPAPAPGSAADDGAAVVSSPGVAVFAYAVLVSMFWPTVAFVGEPAHFAGGRWQTAAALVLGALFAANVALLWPVVRPREPRRDAWVSAHALFLLLPAVALYLLSALPSPRLAGLVGVLFFGPLLFQARFMSRADAWLARLEAPPPRHDAAGGERAAGGSDWPRERGPAAAGRRGGPGAAG